MNGGGGGGRIRKASISRRYADEDQRRWSGRLSVPFVVHLMKQQAARPHFP